MGYSLDFIVAELSCLQCGAVSPADTSTDLQTAMRPQPALAELRVGDRVALPDGPADGYWPTGSITTTGLGLLEVWACPSCGARQWALVQLQDDRLHAVRAVRLSLETLEQAQFVSMEATYEVEPAGLQGDALLQALRQQLPAV